jgi:hypothetical protein
MPMAGSGYITQERNISATCAPIIGLHSSRAAIVDTRTQPVEFFTSLEEVLLRLINRICQRGEARLGRGGVFLWLDET